VPRITNRDRFGNLIDPEQMLKKFKREVAKEGILDEVKKREYFLPKRLARKLKSEKHQRLMRKLNNKSQKQARY
jgi:small subunit ribosomal protein S21